MKKCITILLFLCVMSGAANADVIYNTSSGDLGVIEVTNTLDVSSPVVKYSNAGTDSLLASYAYGDGDFTGIVLIKRSYDMQNTGGDTALTFSPADLSRPLNEFTLTNVYGTITAGYAYNGKSVFVASQYGSAVTEYDSETFAFLNNYILETGGWAGVINDMLVTQGYIYLLITDIEAGTVLLRFDGQLREDIESFASIVIPDGANCLSELGNSGVVIGYPNGIAMIYNRNIVDLTETNAPVKAMCRDYNTDNYGLYYITRSESQSGYVSSLWHYNGASDVLLISQESQANEPNCQLAFDPDNGVFAALMADRIYIYDIFTDKLIAEFDSTSLGGRPVSIAMSDILTNANISTSSSNGCNISTLGAMLLILLGFAIKGARK